MCCLENQLQLRAEDNFIAPRRTPSGIHVREQWIYRGDRPAEVGGPLQILAIQVVIHADGEQVERIRICDFWIDAAYGAGTNNSAFGMMYNEPWSCAAMMLSVPRSY